MKVDLVKYNMSRKACFSVTTIITSTENKKTVKKIPRSHESRRFIQSIFNNYTLLKNSYKNVNVGACNAATGGEAITFDFVEGKSFTSILLDYVNRGDKKEFLESLRLYESILLDMNRLSLKQAHEVTCEFTEIFGDFDIFPFSYIDISNIDLNFDNLLVTGKNTYTMIDYEWVFDFPIPFKYLLFRSTKLFYDYYGIEKFIPINEVFGLFNITDKEVHSFMKMYINFAAFVFGDNNDGERCLIDFCKKHTNLYIFGAGFFGSLMANLLVFLDVDYIGFIVSDGMPKPESYCSHPVYFLSEVCFKDDDTGIILGLAQDKWDKIKCNLFERGAKNIYYSNFPHVEVFMKIMYRL